MALIDSEEAAKRLARVILSDIELYFRERPKAGETLDGQIAEGRRLFASRVVPALAPIFDAVVADRRSANRQTPAPTIAHRWLAAPDTAGSVLTEHPTPGPVLLDQLFEGQPTPLPLVELPAFADLPAPAAPVLPTLLPDLLPALAPIAPATEVHVEAPAASPAGSEASTPAPVVPVSAPVFTPVFTPAPAATPVPVLVPLRTPPPAPPREPPVPRLTPRISVPRLLVLLAIAAAALALIGRALS